jgi:large subunit ribosomal protein L6
MSRVGIKAVDIAQGVTVRIEGQAVHAKGPVGELSVTLPPTIRAEMADGKVKVSRTEETRSGRSLHGLSRTLIANMIEGVSKGFRKDLEIQGVGFKASMQKGKLVLTLGFAAPVEFAVPAGLKVTDQEGVRLAVSGPDKQLVGDTAARIRSFFPAEPYKGKGIRYKGEYVRRKVGKTVA